MKFLRKILLALWVWRLRGLLDHLKIVATVKLLTLYIEAVEAARKATIRLLLMFLLGLLMGCGWLIDNCAVFLLLPDGRAKLWIFLGLGILYLIVPLIFFARMLSSRAWMKCSKADELLEKALEKAEK
jgi:hypothetical protein